MINGLKYRADQITKELHFETSRSSGKGGQHVNKTETRVTLIFDLSNSTLFTQTEKERLSNYLKNRLSNGVLRLSCQESRSQSRNKEIVIDRLFELLSNGLKVRKRRRATSVPKSKIEERLKQKRQLKEKKASRRKPRKNDFE